MDQEKKKIKHRATVGIITFHCSDNFGAMLQAYGLKKYLHNIGINIEIIRYEPCFLTGRHWWIPYVPVGGILRCFRYAKSGWKAHLRMKNDFFKARYNMRHFREKYLIRTGQKDIFLQSIQKTLISILYYRKRPNLESGYYIRTAEGIFWRL